MGQTSYSSQHFGYFFCNEIQFDYSLNKPFIMKSVFRANLIGVFSLLSFIASAQRGSGDNPGHSTNEKHLFLDVHQLKPGTVKYDDVSQAHLKDLAVEGKYDVEILKFWFDQKNARVYCLASAPDAESLRKTHAEAHGLIPAEIYPVTGGAEAALKGNKNLYLDVHYLGAGKATTADVAAAHQKDLQVEKKYGVNLINYWFDEKDGVVMCLAEAKDSNALIKTHKEAHGLLPAQVMKVKQGN
jgi:hypothetical protein